MEAFIKLRLACLLGFDFAKDGPITYPLTTKACSHAKRPVLDQAGSGRASTLSRVGARLTYQAFSHHLHTQRNQKQYRVSRIRYKRQLCLILASVFLILSSTASEGRTLASAINDGRGGTFKLNPSTVYTGGVYITNDSTIDCQGATISIGASSNPSWIWVGSTTLNIRNCTIENGARALYYDTGATGTVSNNTIQDNSTDGILVWNATPTISGNTIRANADIGINVAENSNATILNNTISVNGRGILLQDSNVTIDGNNISGNTVSDGITLVSSGGKISFNTIVNHIGSVGITVSGHSNPTINNNYIAGNFVGIHCQADGEPVIIDNSIEQNSGDGIFVEACSPTVKRNTVQNNGEGGINVYPYSVAIIEENNFSFNGTDGVELTADTSIVRRNTIVGNTLNGIAIMDANGVPSDSVVDHNLIMNNLHSGIAIPGSASPVILANTILGNQLEGVLLNTSSAAQLSRNVINANQDHGVLVMSSARPILVQNLIANNRNFAVFSTGNTGASLQQSSILCGVSGRGVYNQNNVSAWDATMNWWGSASGPSEDGPGNGCTARDVVFDPFLNVPVVTGFTESDFAISAGSTRTIDALSNIGARLNITVADDILGATVNMASFNLPGPIDSTPPNRFVEVSYSDNVIRNLESLEVTIKYDPSKLSQDVGEGALRIFGKNGASGQYVVLQSTVNMVDDQVTATTKFAYDTFAVMPPGTAPELVVGQGPGGENLINTYHGTSGALLDSLSAYVGNGGVSLAVGDVDYDGIDDYVVGEGPGGQNRITIYSGATGGLLSTFGTFSGTTGITVAVGAVTGDGLQKVIVGQGPNGSNYFAVFDLNGNRLRMGQAFAVGDGQGVNVAAGDIDRDGIDDYVVGQGPGGSNVVAIYSGKTGEYMGAYNTFPGSTGVTVAVGDITGNGQKQLVLGEGPNGSNYFGVFDLRGIWLRGGQAFATDPGQGVGISVAVGDFDLDGADDYVTAQGPGSQNIVAIYSGRTGSLLRAYYTIPGTSGVSAAIGNVVP